MTELLLLAGFIVIPIVGADLLIRTLACHHPRWLYTETEHTMTEIPDEDRLLEDKPVIGKVTFTELPNASTRRSRKTTTTTLTDQTATQHKPTMTEGKCHCEWQGENTWDLSHHFVDMGIKAARLGLTETDTP